MEGDVLFTWKTTLSDPNNVLQSWDPTLVNPCTWFHVTCNSDNSVVRVDLGDAGLSGPLVPQLRRLTNLRYLSVYNNSPSGSIPRKIGNLKKLIRLDLYNNQLSGALPASIGSLKSLEFMRVNNNNLTGPIPRKVIQLIINGNLRILNVSNNSLAGTMKATSSTGSNSIHLRGHFVLIIYLLITNYVLYFYLRTICHHKRHTRPISSKVLSICK